MSEIEYGTNSRLHSEGGGLKESSLSRYRLHFPSLANEGSVEGGMVGKIKLGGVFDWWFISQGGSSGEIAKGGKYASRNG